jgi:hypothetical protein
VISPLIVIEEGFERIDIGAFGILKYAGSLLQAM